MAGILTFALHYEGQINKNSQGAVSEAAKLSQQLGTENHVVVVGEGPFEERLASLRHRGPGGSIGRRPAVTAHVVEPGVVALADHGDDHLVRARGGFLARCRAVRLRRCFRTGLAPALAARGRLASPGARGPRAAPPLLLRVTCYGDYSPTEATRVYENQSVVEVMDCVARYLANRAMYSIMDQLETQKG